MCLALTFIEDHVVTIRVSTSRCTVDFTRYVLAMSVALYPVLTLSCLSLLFESMQKPVIVSAEKRVRRRSRSWGARPSCWRDLTLGRDLVSSTLVLGLHSMARIAEALAPRGRSELAAQEDVVVVNSRPLESLFGASWTWVLRVLQGYVRYTESEQGAVS